MTPPNSQTPQADVISAFEWCEKHIPCFDANDNYYKKVIKSLEKRDTAIRQSERAKITAIIEDRIQVYIRKHEIEGGSQETKAEQRFAIEVLERLKSQFQAQEGV